MRDKESNSVANEAGMMEFARAGMLRSLRAGRVSWRFVEVGGLKKLMLRVMNSEGVV